MDAMTLPTGKQVSRIMNPLRPAMLSQLRTHRHAMIAEGALLLFIAIVWLIPLGAARPAPDALVLRPYPDVPEHLWMAQALATGGDLAFPIGAEFHPARYAIVHAALLAGWMRLNAAIHGGEFVHWTHALGYGTLVATFALAAMWLVLRRAGWSWPMRCWWMALVAWSPAIVGIARQVLQEPTLLLFAAVGALAWQRATQLGDSPRCERVAWIAAGCCHGLMIAMRPTYLVVPVIVAAQAVLLSRHSVWSLLPYVAGIVLAWLLVVDATLLLLGRWTTTGYEHWIPGFSPFAVANPFVPPNNLPDGPVQSLRVAHDLLGLSPALAAQGIFGVLALYIGAIGAVAMRRILPAASSESPSVLPFLAWLGLADAVVLTFYNYYEPRFLFLSWIALVTICLAGWRTVFDRLRADGRMSPLVQRALIVSSVFATFAPNHVHDSLSTFRETRGQHAGIVQAARELEDHAIAGPLMRQWDLPVWIDRLDLLSARFLLELTDFPRPFLALTRVVRLIDDGHIPQFGWNDVGPPLGYLSRPSVWPSPPPHCWLVDEFFNGLNRPLLSRAVRQYGGALLYLPVYRLGPPNGQLLNDLEHEYTVRSLHRGETWWLVLVAPKPR